MTPKFRGNSDDWFDDESQGTQGRAPSSKKRAQSQNPAVAPREAKLPVGSGNATVAEIFADLCRVIIDGTPTSETGRAELLCRYRRGNTSPFAQGEAGWRERSPVAVGDRVQVQSTGSRDGVIEALCERETVLFRKAPGEKSESSRAASGHTSKSEPTTAAESGPDPKEQREKRHALVCNIDLLVIVASSLEPEFSQGLVDRAIVAAHAASITPVLVVTKMDLWSPPHGTRAPWAIYQDLRESLHLAGVFEVTRKDPSTLESLRQLIAAKRAAFFGHSGVGKTSVLNLLSGRSIGKTAEISGATGKGRHTTSGAVWLAGSSKNEALVDTPGVREFGLIDIDVSQVLRSFPELKCGGKTCDHLDGSCSASSAERYGSYVRICRSL